MLQLPVPTSGSVALKGTDLTALSGDEMRAKRTDIQMIFQDPISSLNPRRKVFDIVSEGISVWGGGMTKVILALSITAWIEIARLTRGQMYSLREKEYVDKKRVDSDQ